MSDLTKKEFDPESIVDQVISSEKLRSEIIQNLLLKNDTLRYNSHKVLTLISERNPEILYPDWDFFANLLESKNNFHITIGIEILANLASIDKENKIEKIIETFFKFLGAKSVMTASKAAVNLGKIARYKRNLQMKISIALLNIDSINHQEQRKDLIKGYIIEAFELYFEDIKEKSKILEFIKTQVNSQSPKTRKIAQSFLKNHDQTLYFIS